MGREVLRVVFLLLAATSHATAHDEQTSNYVAGSCVDNSTFDDTHDYFPAKAYPAFADELFNVSYQLSYKVIENFSKTEKQKLVLWQCGTPKPAVAGATRYIEVPVTKVALGDTTFLPRIEQLGERTAIVAYISNTSYITSPCVRQLLADGSIAEAFYTANVVPKVTCPNNTALEELGAEVVFATHASRYCPDGTSTELYNAVTISDYEESGDNPNLKFADWLKYFSYFFNQEALARSTFASLVARFECTETNAVTCSARNNDVVSVAWVPFYYDGVGWALSETGTYYDEAITAGGGEMISCPAGTVTTSYSGSVAAYMTDDEFVACVGAAQVCIVGEVDKIYTAASKKDVLDRLNCTQSQRLFDYQLSGPDDWFEARVAEPDVLLEDLVLALHGDDSDTYGIPGGTRVWLRNALTEAVGSSDDVSQCLNVSAPLLARGAECTDAALEICGARAGQRPGAASVAVVATLALAMALMR